MLALRLDPDGPLRVLCIGAHSDDIEIGCGGSVSRIVAEHAPVAVKWVVFTSSPEREAETRMASRRLLSEAASFDVTVHDFRDGFLPMDAAEVKDVFEELKADEQDLVFTHWRGDAHQDHRLLSELTWNTFRNHMILEYEIPKYDGDLGRPNFYVPLNEAIVERKITTILDCFASQRKRGWFEEETFRSILRLRGIECNAPERYAEAFHVRKLVL